MHSYLGSVTHCVGYAVWVCWRPYTDRSRSVYKLLRDGRSLSLLFSYTYCTYAALIAYNKYLSFQWPSWCTDAINTKRDTAADVVNMNDLTLAMCVRQSSQVHVYVCVCLCTSVHSSRIQTENFCCYLKLVDTSCSYSVTPRERVFISFYGG